MAQRDVTWRRRLSSIVRFGLAVGGDDVIAFHPDTTRNEPPESGRGLRTLVGFAMLALPRMACPVQWAGGPKFPGVLSQQAARLDKIDVHWQLEKVIRL